VADAGCSKLPFLGGGLSSYPAITAVKTHPGRCVVDHGFVINIFDNGGVGDVIDRAVICKLAVVPTSTLITRVAITETVVDAAVKTDMRAPIAGVECVAAAAITPVSRGPQETDLRRQNPGAGNPKISFVTVGLITRDPYVVLLRNGRLYVDRQFRRRNRDRDADANNLRERRGGGCNHGACCTCSQKKFFTGSVPPNLGERLSFDRKAPRRGKRPDRSVGSTSRLMRRISVALPELDKPISTKISPSFTSKTLVPLHRKVTTPCRQGAAADQPVLGGFANEARNRCPRVRVACARTAMRAPE
jgi:hypothetical protein